MTPDRPPSDSDPLRDPRFDAEWRARSREEPPATLDARILAAAHRAVGTGPQRADVREATRPERWWWPLAAAASIGAVAFGILQVIGPDPAEGPLAERAVVSDAPMQPSSQPAPSLPAATESTSQRDTRADAAPAPPPAQPVTKQAPIAPPLAKPAPRQAPVAPPKPAAAPEPAPEAPPALARDATAPREAAGASAVGGAATAPAPSARPAAAFRAEAQRKTAAPLAIDEWLERIRKLRAEGSTDELAREIAAFRAAYPAEEKRLQEELARPLPPRQ